MNLFTTVDFPRQSVGTEAERQIAIERNAKEKAEAENKLLRGLLIGRAA